MDKKLFRDILLIVAFVILLVTVVVKIDVVMALNRPMPCFAQPLPDWVRHCLCA